MNQPSSKLCPKCGKPFIEKRTFNSNYDIYVHDREPNSIVFNGLTRYCIVTKDYVYNHPEPDVTGRPLNPGYRTLKPQANQ